MYIRCPRYARGTTRALFPPCGSFPLATTFASYSYTCGAPRYDRVDLYVRVVSACREREGEGDEEPRARVTASRKNVCRGGIIVQRYRFSVIIRTGDRREEGLCDQCLTRRAEGGASPRPGFRAIRIRGTKMKLEYPCRVEGWLNVCGECTRLMFTCRERVSEDDYREAATATDDIESRNSA